MKDTAHKVGLVLTWSLVVYFVVVLVGQPVLAFLLAKGLPHLAAISISFVVNYMVFSFIQGIAKGISKSIN